MRILSLSICFLLLLGCENKKDLADNAGEDKTQEVASEVASELVAIAATNVLNIGDVTPDFELMGTDGEKHSLAAMAEGNKGFIVTFTCNTCPYAVKYEDRLIALHNEMAPLGYPIVAIQPNDTEIRPDDSMEAMIQRVADKNIPYTYLIDKDQSVYPTYGATRTPEIFLINKDRELLYHGAIDDDVEGTDVTVNYVKKAIESYEAGQTIDPVDVKAIGCTIKAK